jgi:hypothetical protein
MKDLDAMLGEAAKVDGAERGEHVDDGGLLAYRRKTLSLEEEERVDVHLASCPSCRELLKVMEPEVPELSARKARDALVQKSRLPVWIAAAAAILLVGVSIALLGRGQAVRYTIEGPFGGISETRGPDAPPSAIFDKNSTVRIRVRPQSATTTQVKIAATVAPIDGPPHTTEAFDIEWTSAGAAELSAPASALFPKHGKYRLRVIAGDIEMESLCDYTE